MEFEWVSEHKLAENCGEGTNAHDAFVGYLVALSVGSIRCDEGLICFSGSDLPGGRSCYNDITRHLLVFGKKHEN